MTIQQDGWTKSKLFTSILPKISSFLSQFCITFVWFSYHVHLLSPNIENLSICLRPSQRESSRSCRAGRLTSHPPRQKSSRSKDLRSVTRRIPIFMWLLKVMSMIRLSTTCHHSLCKGLHSCWFMFPCPTSIHTHPAVGRPTPLGPEGNAGYQLAILSGAECMDLLASNMPGIRPQPTSSLVLRSWPRCHHKTCLFQNPWIGILYKGALHLVFAFTVSIFDDPLRTSSAQAGTKSCKKQDYNYYRSENVEKNRARLVAGVAVQICLSKQTQKKTFWITSLLFSSLSGASLSFSFSSDLQ